MLEQSLAKQMLPLLLGRMAAFCIAFAVPLVLVRTFTTEAFGIYKQLLLIQGTLTPILSMGITASLFYFIPRAPTQRAAYITQTLTLLFLLGLSGATGLILLRSRIGSVLNNTELERYVPLLGTFLFLYLLTYVLEDLMVISKQSRLAMMTIMTSEILRALMVSLAGL